MAAMVSSGSQLSNLVFAFSPAYTSNQAISFLPPYAFLTAASKTRWEAAQMSGPVPSPSMNGMTGRSGTESFPSFMVMVSPVVGAFRSLYVGDGLMGSGVLDGTWGPTFGPGRAKKLTRRLGAD